MSNNQTREISKKMKMPNQLSTIEYRNLKFIVFDAPSNSNLESYRDGLKSMQVKNIVRCCDPTYDKQKMIDVGIKVHEMPFTDGDSPPKEITQQWLELVSSVFPNSNINSKSGNNSKTGNDLKGGEDNEAIGIHCIAGLGYFVLN
jgi:protein tyrosine phosphatase type 4A